MTLTKCPTSPDVVGTSPRFRQYALDSVSATIQADGGAACRDVMIVAPGAGTIIVTPASPLDDTPTEAVNVDSFPPGTRLGISATNIAKGTAAGVKLLIMWCLMFALAGCASARDAAVATLNASADFAKTAEPALEDLDRRDQQAVIDATKTREDAAAQLAGVRARYRKAWTAYRDCRASWLAAAAAVWAYDSATRAKLTKSEDDFRQAVVALVAAEGELADAISVIRQGGVIAPPAPSPAPTPAPASKPIPAAAPQKGGAS